MTNGLRLEGVYGDTLGRIQAQGGERSRLGMAALMWMCYSERLLKASELCHALAVEIGSMDFDLDNIPSIQTVQDCCQGLVMMDKEGSTVRLVHFTLREYLSGRSDLFQKSHSVIAETCLTYLNSRQVMNLSATRSPETQATPFLEYSALYWGTHGKKEPSDDAKWLALKLFGQYDNHISIRLLLESQHPGLSLFSDLSPFTGLHCASLFGLAKVVETLIEIPNFDINQRDPIGITPLGWAAQNGQEEVVQLLLGQGDVEPDKLNRDGRTPLSYAAQNGHKRVAQLLLGLGDVKPDKLDGYGRTPLSYAAQNGHKRVAQLLLGLGDVNSDKLDGYGRTPLSYAAENGNEGVARLLLLRGDVNPDKVSLESGHDNRAPLSYAAENGHEGVVDFLLGRENVNPDRPDKWRRAPLSYAAENGHDGVVQLLLGRGGVNPDRLDRWGLTPLSYAQNKGHEGVVKLILDWKSSRLPPPWSSET